MCNEVAGCVGARDVPFRTDGTARLQPHVPDCAMSRQEIGNRLLAVIHDDELFARILLSQKIASSPPYERRPIRRRHEAGYECRLAPTDHAGGAGTSHG